MVRSVAGCVPTGVPLPHSYHAPNPRPRLPAMIRTPRPPLYQQPLPLGKLIYICFDNLLSITVVNRLTRMMGLFAS